MQFIRQTSTLKRLSPVGLVEIVRCVVQHLHYSGPIRQALLMTWAYASTSPDTLG